MSVDNIESNITAVADNTREASNELDIAHEYQRKAGRRAACLMIVLAIVICIVLLAVSGLSSRELCKSFYKTPFTDSFLRHCTDYLNRHTFTILLFDFNKRLSL